MTPTDTEPIYFDLGPTATYRRRRAGWFAGPGEHTDGRAGTLRIVLEKAKRSGDSTECDEYGVSEVSRGLPAGVRGLRLVKDDPAEPDAYRCMIGADSNGLVYDACTCKAGQYGTACKHVAAASKLIAEGVL